MSEEPKYLLVADSFIRSKREHYAFDFCPGYWSAILQQFARNRLGSILPIRNELLRGKDALANWVKSEAPQGLFDTVDSPVVNSAFRKVATWAEDNSRYSRAAKQAFLEGADPWLVAFAAENRLVIVSYEVSSPDSKSRIKLPDAAKEFGISCVPPYVMLRQLKVRLCLDESPTAQFG